MNRILLISIFLSAFIGCTPQMNSLKQASCDDGHYFDEITRSCILDVSPKAPVITTTSVSMIEDAAMTSFPISFTDQNGGIPTSCTIVDSSTGLNQTITIGSMTFERVNTWQNAMNYSELYLELVDNPSVSAGSEVVSIATNTITVQIDAGFSTSLQIINAINSSVVINPIIVATITGPNTTESPTPGIKMLGATCECISGTCSMNIEPSRHTNGSSYIDFYISDDDGDSAVSRLYVDVTNVDQAPSVAATRSATVSEDSLITFEFDSEVNEIPVSGYFDYDGDFATYCIASSIHASVQNSNISCNCSLGKCTLAFTTSADYFNATAEDMVEYQIYANGQYSNTGVASVRVTEVDDEPVAANIITVTVDEDSTGTPGAQTAVGLYFPTASDDSYMGFPSSDLRYKFKNLTSYPDIQGSCTGAPGDTFHANSVDDATFCNLFFDGDANGVFTVEYQISDSILPLTSMADFHTTGYINVVINAKNDPPVVAGGPFSHTMNESSDWNSVSETITLGSVSDVDNTTSSLTVYFIDGSGNRINTMAGQGTLAGTEGTIKDCAISSGGAITCLYETLNGNSANTMGTPDDFQFVVRDSSNAESVVQTLDVVVQETSDAPVICNYSVYDRRAGRTECGVNNCIGHGAPSFNPTSHVSDNPVVYFDRTNGLCYESVDTNDWAVASNNGVQNASFMSDVIVGEKEDIIIDNVIISEGGSINEASQTVTIENVVSTNNVLIQPMNIQFLKDTDLDGEYSEAGDLAAVNGAMASGIIDNGISINEVLRIKMIPTASQYGETTISFDLVDNGTGAPRTSVSFKVRVEPQTVAHHGWADVKALGTKVNHFGIRVESNFTCSHSLTKCDGGKECYGTVSPATSNVVPDAAGAIYRTAANQCYYSTGTTSNDWVLISKSVACNISEVNRDFTTNGLLEDTTTTCDDLNSASCIGDVTYDSGDASSVSVVFNSQTETLLASDNDGKFLFNTGYRATTGEDCFYSDGTNWIPYHGTSRVSLEWENFTVGTSGAIQGYNVYRKKAGPLHTFNYSNPLNRDLITSSNTYIDNGENSRLAPVPNHTYVYEVRPVLSFTNQLGDNESLEITTNNNVAKLTVVAPQENFAFVHHWMVNKKACEMMHSDSFIDSNYVCEYKGFGDTASALGTIGSIYDFGKDLLVPRFEMGCPYSKTSCDTTDGQCVAQNLGAYDGPDGSVFYERSTGSCYVKNGVWQSFSNQTLDSAVAFQSFLPPLTNITNANAVNACTNLTGSPTIVGYGAATSYKLPTRDEQIAYSAWDVRATSDANIEVVERGLALNSSSKCNASGASGLESSYMDIDNLSSSDIHTIPGTNSSGIRSLHTGSVFTQDCTSAFGVQDAVGNVAEISDTAYSFNANIYSFSSIVSTKADIYGGTGDYLMDSFIGPCNDSDGDNVCDLELDSHLFENVSDYSARYFNYVFGIPISNAAKATEDAMPGSVINDYTLRIGSTAGITNSQLHDDEIFRIFNNTNGVNGSMVSGGDYASLSGAGVYAFEFLPDAEASSRIGLRCVIELDPNQYD